MQLNKNIKIFLNYFLGPLLFAWLAFSIYNEVLQQPRLEESWQSIRTSFHSYRVFYLVFAILLIAVNWGIEALKWQLSVRSVHPLRFSEAFRAVLSGVSFSVTMANRVGEYIGRMAYMPEGSRLRTVSVTLVGSFAQVLITLFAGTLGLVVLKRSLLQAFPSLTVWYQFALYGMIFLLVVISFFYFNTASVGTVFSKWIRWKRYAYLVEALSDFQQSLLVRLLLLSFLRYLVFIIQYFLVFRLFGVETSFETIGWVMSLVFLAMAVIPSIALLEVGLRGEISIRLMGLYSANTLGIGFTSVTVWCMNLVLPAIIGSIFLFNLRLFRKRNEKL